MRVIKNVPLAQSAEDVFSSLHSGMFVILKRVGEYHAVDRLATREVASKKYMVLENFFFFADGFHEKP